MRLSDVLGSRVVDSSGATIGIVHDVHARAEEGVPAEIAGLVVDRGGPLTRAAHSWGYAAGRASGPLVVRVVLCHAARRARFIATAAIGDWGPPVVTSASWRELPELGDEVGR